MFIGENHGVRPPPINRDRDLVGVDKDPTITTIIRFLGPQYRPQT